MKYLPVILFFIYVYIEVSLFVAVANSIGVFLALSLLILTSVVGLSLVKSQGLQSLASIRKKMLDNQDINTELNKNIMLLLSGFLLLIPGFLTDMLGAMLFLPVVQKFVTKYFLARISSARDYQSSSFSTLNDEVIEGEFKRKNGE